MLKNNAMSSCKKLGLIFTLSALLATGCKSADDACKGMTETCLSLTLLGTEGVAQVDQLEVVLARTQQPAMALGSAQDLPVKVAVLWPEGGATVSVRSYLAGVLNGASTELTLDLRGGAHDKRSLTLYRPIEGPGPADLAGFDLATPRPKDMTTPDMATPDMSTPDLATPDMAMPDLAVPMDLTAGN